MNLSVTGERIKEQREAKDMTQTDLSKVIGKTADKDGKGRISRYENGQVPPIKTILLLSEVFGCSPEYLLGTDPFPNRTVSDEEAGRYFTLSEATITLLLDLKNQCKKCEKSTPLKCDSLLTEMIADCVTACIIGTNDIGGLNGTLLPLMREYLDATKTADKYGGLFVDNRSDEHSLAKWKCEAIEEKIGEVLGKVVCEQLRLATIGNFRITDSILKKMNGAEANK